MCGIAGYFSFVKDRPAQSLMVGKMLNQIIHRGPDGEGTHFDGPVGLGHRRLSIIDLASGSQPMHSADGSMTLIYNGELYNYLDLRQELVKLGHQFRTSSDTEVILASYAQWGTDCLEMFNGMWAFALWDQRKQTLFCSRDRLGEKPFYFAEHDGMFLFASEPKGLFRVGVNRELDVSMLDTLLCLAYLPAPYSIYKNLRKLAAGHYLEVSARGIDQHRYWQYPSQIITPDISGDSAYEEFKALLQDSVIRRMQSDVPLGAFLSGGLDSSVAVAIMAQNSDTPIKTNTIGFSPEGEDERSLARLTADLYHTDHVEEVVELPDANDLVDKLAWHFDEPFGDSSIFPTYVVSKLARERVTVVLTGDGGDEVLAGYPAHQSEKLAGAWHSLPALVRSPLGSIVGNTLESLGQVARSEKLRRASTLVNATTANFVERLLIKQVGFSPQTRVQLLKPVSGVVPAHEVVQDLLKPFAQASDMQKLNAWFHTVALPERYLQKVDRCSMAVSLEARVPFLDHRLVEFMAGMPHHIKMPRLNRKHVLKASFATSLPIALLQAPKQGFEAPTKRWMGGNPKGFWTDKLAGLGQSQLLDEQQLQTSLETDKTMGLWTLAMLSAQMNSNPAERAA